METDKAGIGSCLNKCHHCGEWYSIQNSHYHQCSGKLADFRQSACMVNNLSCGETLSNIGGGSSSKDQKDI
jgi:hypothetical protein